jgi:hypothetical protein
LIIGAAVVLLSLDLITADQSQAAFLGVPVLFVGVVVGLLVGASAAGVVGGALAGMCVGFAFGVAASVALASVLIGVPFFLFIAPFGMLVGGIGGAWWVERDT